MERRHLLSTGMVLALGGLLPAAGAAEAAVNTKRGLLINGVAGNTVNRAGQSGTFTGSILIKRLGFDSETRTLKVYGFVSGTSTTAGEVVNQRFAAIAALASGAGASRAPAVCSILNLVLGPLHLNLLGLVIDLNKVILNITGVTGALLGDLLCALAGLLNPGLGPLGPILNLLSKINVLLSQLLVIVNPPAAR
jgi:hypothetical protein